MKYCWRVNEDQIDLLPPMFVLFVLLCVSNGLREMMVSSDPVRYLGVAFVLLIIVLPLPGLASILSVRKYEISRDGLTLRYPFGISKHYRWEEFGEVALCKVHYAAASNKHILAIRCAVGDEKRGPKKATVAKGNWSTIEYEAFHFGKIITIYYTDERYEEFQEKCPLEIGDYRYLSDHS